MKEGLLHRQQPRQLAVDYVCCGAPGLVMCNNIVYKSRVLRPDYN